MQLLYNSDSFVVVQIEVAPLSGEGTDGLVRGGFEIVDKFARKEIFLEGRVAERFEAGVKQIVAESDADGPSAETLDEYIAGFTVLAQQPVLMH
jgi:hypothetical protein